MKDRIMTTFAILCALCVVVAALGGVAIWDVYRNLIVRSSVQGEVISEASIPERETIYDFDDSTLYFSYTMSDIVWLDDPSADRYYIEYQFNRMAYDSATRRYAVYLNDIEGRGTNYFSALEAAFDLLFTSPHGEDTLLQLYIKFAFYSNKTTMRVEIPRADYNDIGYFNTLINEGVTIDIWESTSIAALPPHNQLETVDYGLTFDTPATDVVFDLSGTPSTSCNLYIWEISNTYPNTPEEYILTDAQFAGYSGYNYIKLFSAQKQQNFVIAISAQTPTSRPADFQISGGTTSIVQLDYFKRYLMILILGNPEYYPNTVFRAGASGSVTVENSSITHQVFKRAYYIAINNLGAENVSSKINQNKVFIKIDANSGA